MAMKAVQFWLDEVQHRDFKTWCASRGTNMRKQVVWWITNECCGEVGKIPATASKRVVAASEPIAQGEVRVAMQSCARCSEDFPVADMITDRKTGKLFCKDCVDNIKNGQV